MITAWLHDENQHENKRKKKISESNEGKNLSWISSHACRCLQSISINHYLSLLEQSKQLCSRVMLRGVCVCQTHLSVASFFFFWHTGRSRPKFWERVCCILVQLLTDITCQWWVTQSMKPTCKMKTSMRCCSFWTAQCLLADCIHWL